VFGFAVFGEVVFGATFDFVGTISVGSRPSSLTANVRPSLIDTSKYPSQLRASYPSSVVDVKVRPSELKAEGKI
jgi:hypothetical protein